MFRKTEKIFSSLRDLKFQTRLKIKIILTKISFINFIMIILRTIKHSLLFYQ